MVHLASWILFSAGKKWAIKLKKIWWNLKCILWNKRSQSKRLHEYCVIPAIGYSGKAKLWRLLKKKKEITRILISLIFFYLLPLANISSFYGWSLYNCDILKVHDILPKSQINAKNQYVWTTHGRRIATILEQQSFHHCDIYKMTFKF